MFIRVNVIDSDRYHVKSPFIGCKTGPNTNMYEDGSIQNSLTLWAVYAPACQPSDFCQPNP